MPKLYQCSYCTFTSTIDDYMLDHVLTVHPDGDEEEDWTEVDHP